MLNVIGASARRAPQWAALAVAALAAVLLTVTVSVTARSVERAGAALTRGEGESLIRSVVERAPGDPELTQAELERVLVARRGAGLRFIAITDQDLDEVAHAGEAQLADAGPLRPGRLIVRGQRARLVQPLPPSLGRDPRPHRPPPPAEEGGPPRGGFPPGPPGGGFPPGPPGGPLGREGEPPGPGHHPLLVIEFEPTLVTGLSTAMSRARIVAAAAAILLLVVAGVLGRRIARATEEERRGERDRRLVALGEMSAVMAHELRNPIASLKGNAQLLAENLEEGTRSRTKADLVVSEAERLERLTRALLDFVREAPLELRRCALGEVAERVLAAFPEERLALTIDAPEAQVDADEARLGVAVGNLVRNALESDPEGTVEVRVFRAEGRVCLEVRDHGPGLPEAEGERIFEPFVTTRVKGTGLGLAIARRAVEQHGGTLIGENPAGGGARFCVALPPARRSST